MRAPARARPISQNRSSCHAFPMAAEPQLVHVRTFCDLEKEAQHDVSLAVLRGELNAGPLTLVQLVCVMDEQLVSADNLTRARSVLLLSEARAPRRRCAPRPSAAHTPSAPQLLPAAELSPAHVSQLAIFFASKLADWCVDASQSAATAAAAHVCALCRLQAHASRRAGRLSAPPAHRRGRGGCPRAGRRAAPGAAGALAGRRRAAAGAAKSL